MSRIQVLSRNADVTAPGTAMMGGRCCSGRSRKAACNCCAANLLMNRVFVRSAGVNSFSSIREGSFMVIGVVIGLISLLTVVSVYWCVVRRSNQEQNADAGQR